MQELALKLRSTSLFASIPKNPLISLLESSMTISLLKGESLFEHNEKLSCHEHIIVLKGEIEAQRHWRTDAGSQQFSWKVSPESSKGNLAIIAAHSSHLSIKALTDAECLLLDANDIDSLLSWGEEIQQIINQNPKLASRLRQVKRVGIFHHLPPSNIVQAFQKMKIQAVSAGDVIFKERDEGDCYYLIEEGEAEVIRTDPFTDETAVVDQIGPGDGFGEVALMQQGYRTATIRMLTPGQLWVLDKADFQSLIQPAMMDEISADAAQALLLEGKASLLDCRWSMEFDESRIPGAKLIPLHMLHFHVHELNPETSYIVYCYAGARSRAAVFLLRERNFKVLSLAGGIKAWPYEIDEVPV